MTVNEILDQVRAIFTHTLQAGLTGIYLHGSLAFNCFTWENSDIDFLTVVNADLTHPEKTAIIKSLLELNGQAPPKGIEMSIVSEEHCRNFTYPTPFLLHFSNAHKAACEKDLDAFCRTMNGTDKDLAAHFTVIRSVGISLCGKPIREVFAQVPKEHYLDSVKCDIENAETEIAENPVYTVLNLCRTLAYIREDLILSKKQGGEWALQNLPSEYRSVISSALQEYSAQEKPAYNNTKLRTFARFMLNLILQPGSAQLPEKALK